MKLNRNAKGQFVKGNKEGKKFDSHGGSAAAQVSNRNQREKRTEAEVYDYIASLPLPDDMKEIHKTFDKYGVPVNDRTLAAATAINMHRLSLGNGREAIAAAGQIHRSRTDGKLDITTNGKDIKSEPLIIEVIDSREQIDAKEQE